MKMHHGWPQIWIIHLLFPYMNDDVEVWNKIKRLYIQLTTFMFASGKLGRYFNWSSEASVSVMKNNEKTTARNFANMLTVILLLENRRAYQNTLIYFFWYGCMTTRDARLRSVVVACRNVSTFGTPGWCSWTKNRRIPMIHYMSAKKSFLQLSY